MVGRSSCAIASGVPQKRSPPFSTGGRMTEISQPLFFILSKQGFEPGKDFSCSGDGGLVIGQGCMDFLLEKGILEREEIPLPHNTAQINSKVRIELANKFGIDVVGGLVEAILSMRERISPSMFEEYLLCIDCLLLEGVGIDLFAMLMVDSRVDINTKESINQFVQDERSPSEGMQDRTIPLVVQTIMEAAAIKDYVIDGDGNIDTTEQGAFILQTLIHCEILS